MVGYRSASHADALLASLGEGVAPYTPALCLVDNGSGDGTAQAFAEAARKHWPHELILHSTGTNLGFTGGTEEGLRRIDEGGACDFVVLLNPDTVVRRGWLSGLLAPFEDPAVGVTGSVLLLPSGRIDARGCGIHYLGFGFTVGHGAAVGTPCPAATYASGAAMAISRNALTRLRDLSGDGLFWRGLFLYHDDLDLGWRARLAGFQVQIAPESVVVHDHAFDGRPGNEQKFSYMERNRWLCLLANYRLATLAVLAPLLLLAELALAVAVRKPGAGRLATYRAVGRALDATFWERRRRLQARRRRSDRDLLAAFHGRLDHPEAGGGGAWLNAVSAAAFAFVRILVRW